MYQRNRIVLFVNAVLCLLCAVLSAMVITFFFPSRHVQGQSACRQWSIERALYADAALDAPIPCYAMNDPHFTLCLVPRASLTSNP